MHRSALHSLVKPLEQILVSRVALLHGRQRVRLRLWQLL